MSTKSVEQLASRTPTIDAYVSDESKWDSVLQRDCIADGHFYYGVVTTGIYCVPSCASRKPLRKNVRFFSSVKEAELNGLRPCLRCRPNERHQAGNAIHEIARFISQNAGSSHCLEQLAKRAVMSPGHFQKKFKAEIGLTPKKFQEACRTQLFKAALRSSNNITEAIYAAGYGSSSRAYENVDNQLGMSPTAFRQQGEGELISYAFADSDIGKLLLAATGKGLCFLHIGKQEEPLMSVLNSTFPSATIEPMPSSSRKEFAGWIASLNEYLAGKTRQLSLPLDIRGTAFQKIVWDYLQSIPPGTTQSYTEVAQGIGKPTAARAVASACAKNSIAIAVPCHRVLRGDGFLSGYRWEVSRKQQLLDIEAQAKKISVILPPDSRWL